MMLCDCGVLLKFVFNQIFTGWGKSIIKLVVDPI